MTERLRICSQWARFFVPRWRQEECRPVWERLETGAVRVGRKTLIVASAASQSKKSWIPAVKGGSNFLDSEWLDGS
ncbi:hypothetical protein Bca52824_056254 [Brassica carinata]|uniref:Uncharacterized protein n=1 Tax=Brassica carinata TaxID=52824 RepID=A0A8X7QUZ4_BRACI|nr:hypothetical protein Bca52824_056254 [Brassica carinata]